MTIFKNEYGHYEMQHGFETLYGDTLEEFEDYANDILDAVEQCREEEEDDF